MITITFNAKPLSIPENISILDLLHLLRYEHSGFAIAINRNFIPQANYSTTRVNPDDRIELVAPMQGG